MSILITGSAGFIGFSIASDLLKHNKRVIGIDNLNNYYSKKLKNKRINYLKKSKKFKFIKLDCSSNKFKNYFLKKKISLIIHLAAEVGVRNSFYNPYIYYQNNLRSFFNVLEICRKNNSNLIFASSSSVYGSSDKSFFKESDNTSSPLSFYAATKKCNELMAYSYTKNYNFSSIGIRFFNVYGPWGRPDMSIYKFTDLMIKNKKIPLYGSGKQLRDFTYIDDVVNLTNILIKKLNIKKKGYYDIFNSGKGNSINILNLLNILSNKLNIKPKIQKKEKQRGDVFFTNSSSIKIREKLNYVPKIKLKKGIDSFLKWYLEIGSKIK